ncbi:Gfo/Idh/MocA family oxidoreductase [Candidatus Bathyarchaeota archaeon]|nr:Gfo/Idh/MocA family oxidoreductase [Candidatus Bathyarchaeota archaeon]
MSIRIGIVGCGSVSQRGLLPHLSAEDVKDKVRLAAICDVVEERAKACKERFNADEWYSSYEDMLSKAGLDAVTIATPIQLHYEQALKAIRAGVHVHLNKPMTLTVEEADTLLNERDRAEVKLVASPGIAFRKDIERVRSMLKDGIVGKIYWVRTGATAEGHEYEDFRKPGDLVVAIDPSWYYKRGGGPVYDMGIYALHLITGVLGPAMRVTAMSGIGLKRRIILGKEVEVEMDDNTVMLLDFGDSIFALLHSAFCMGDGEPFSGLHIAGSDGVLKLEHGHIEVWSRKLESWHYIEEPSSRLPYVSGVHVKLPEAHIYSDIMHLIDCILNDKEPVISGEHARHVIEIIEKAYLSAKTEKTQHLQTSFQLKPLKEW